MNKLKAVRIFVLLFLLVGSFGGRGVALALASMTIINEPFNGASTPFGWTFLGDAVMETNWLRLTHNIQNQAGAVFYNLGAFSPLDAFVIDFDYASYGGSTPIHADGLAFFMIDGDPYSNPTTAGSIGSGLGFRGMSGAYFAVGLDEYGGGTNPNVAIWNSAAAINTFPASIETGSRTTPKHVRISICRNHVSVWLAGEQKLNNVELDLSAPASVKVGFSASTGSGTNYHEIRNVVIQVSSGISYVKPAVSGSGDCTNWANACALQTALASAMPGLEIWVAGGVYKPTLDTTDRAATFQLRPGVSLYGGFDGQVDDAISERNLTGHPTILSGDIDNNDNQRPVITDLTTETNNSNNSFHVVTGADGATLDGFTITGGYALPGVCLGTGCGGGMYSESGSPSLRNIIFSGNKAAKGGGLFSQGGSPRLLNVIFRQNSADTYGGGMENMGGSPSLKNVTFSEDSATYGGGMYNMYDTGGSSLINVTFSGNLATYGGGMAIMGGEPTLTNVTFSGNLASVGGGAFIQSDFASIRMHLTNVTFNANSANYGGVLYANNLLGTEVRLWLKNSILWGNGTTPGGAQVYTIGAVDDYVSDSVIEGGYPDGQNILTADPRLGSLGYYGGDTQTIPLHPHSSALDVLDAPACPPTDQRGESRPQGSKCDLGAFEGTVDWIVHLPYIRR